MSADANAPDANAPDANAPDANAPDANAPGRKTLCVSLTEAVTDLHSPAFAPYLTFMETLSAQDVQKIEKIELGCSWDVLEVRWDAILLFLAHRFPNVRKLSIRNGHADARSLRGFSNLRDLTYMPETWSWDFDYSSDDTFTSELQSLTYGQRSLDCKEMEPEKIDWFLQRSARSLQWLTLTGHVLIEIDFLKRFDALKHLDIGVQELYDELAELPVSLRNLETVIVRIYDGDDFMTQQEEVKKKAPRFVDAFKRLEHIRSFLLEWWDLWNDHTTISYWLA